MPEQKRSRRSARSRNTLYWRSVHDIAIKISANRGFLMGTSSLIKKLPPTKLTKLSQLFKETSPADVSRQARVLVGGHGSIGPGLVPIEVLFVSTTGTTVS